MDVDRWMKIKLDRQNDTDRMIGIYIYINNRWDRRHRFKAGKRVSIETQIEQWTYIYIYIYVWLQIYRYRMIQIYIYR